MFTELREQLAAKQFVDTSMAATEIKNDDINKRGRKMIRVGIIGATGYAGGELVRILLNHKDAKIVWYGSRSYIDKKYYQVYQNMFQLVEDICKDDNLEELAKQAGKSVAETDYILWSYCATGYTGICTKSYPNCHVCRVKDRCRYAKS